MSIKPSGIRNTISSLNEDLSSYLKHYGPVTCLKIYNEYVLCGYGPLLRVFEIKDHAFKEIFCEVMLYRNKIHNISISPNGSQIALSGGRSFAVLNLNKVLSQDLSPKNNSGKGINEWIISTEFRDENTLLILNSHNTVYVVDIADNDSTKILLQVDCNEKSILYSGSMRIIENDIYVSAGTVMHGVIIWELNTRKIIHKLTDHEGSIFATKIDKHGEHVVSCSDDRSINLYDFKSGKLMATGWGHGSRIWSLDFSKEFSPIRILSTGEDCTARVWEYRPNAKTLKQIQQWDCHLGKHVWSGSFDDTGLGLAVTGGADGRLVLHSCSSLNESNQEIFQISEISEKINIKFEKNEIIKQFQQLPSINSILLLTSRGKLLRYNYNSFEWLQIPLTAPGEEKFNNFGILRTLPGTSAALLCSRNGDILCVEFVNGSDSSFRMQWYMDDNLHGNKVTNFLVVKQPHEDLYHALVDCPNTQLPFILKCFKYENGEIQLISTKFLEQPKQTSFTTTCMTVDNGGHHLVLGSRYVSICVYDLSSQDNRISLRAIFKKISVGDSISSISIIDSNPHEYFLLVTVRDGIYLYVCLSIVDDVYKLDIMLKNKISRGFVMGGFLANNNLILYGFKSTSFYIWNESKQIEVANVLCGGSHRQWELFSGGSESDIRMFLFVNKATLHIQHLTFNFSVDSCGIMDEGTHGREIRDCNISQKFEHDGSKLLATVSEDATMRLGKLYLDGSVRNLWSMNEHVSGLQKVKFLDHQFLASSGANEEFYIWKISYINRDLPLVYCCARLNSLSKNLDLRIMDFDYILTDDGYYIVTVYSDSSIKLWHFNTSSLEFIMISEGKYTSCCILNVKFLVFGSGETYILIGATDGFLSVWSASQLLEIKKSDEKLSLKNCLIHEKLHQNSIKCALYIQRENSFTIITGGDDNSLVNCSLKLCGAACLSLDIRDKATSAASSTITSLCPVNNFTFAVTSVDQIVRLWTITQNGLRCIMSKYTTVADTGCCDSTMFNGSTNLVIGGAGLSSWKIESIETRN